MLTVSLLPCSVGSLEWARDPELPRTTLVVKRTYRLAPGLPLAEEQEPLCDEAQGDVPTTHRPHDLVPYKARVDCIVTPTSSPNTEPEVLLHRAGAPTKRLRVEPPGSLRRTSLGLGGRILSSSASDTGERETHQTSSLDQQLDELLHGDVLELRWSEGAPLRLAIPTAPTQIVIFDDGPEPRLLELRADTLIIDVDRALLALTARADVPKLADAAIVVVTEGRSAASLDGVVVALSQDASVAPWLRAWSERRGAREAGARARPARTTRRFKAETQGASATAQLPREPGWLTAAAVGSPVFASTPQPAWAAQASAAHAAPIASPEQQATLVLEVPHADELYAAHAVGAAIPPPPALSPPTFEPRAAKPAPVEGMNADLAPPGRVQTTFEERRDVEGSEAQLPSYLKGRPRLEPVRAGPMHDGRAALSGLTAASDAAAEGAPVVKHQVEPAAASASEQPRVVDVLFVDERALKDAGLAVLDRMIADTIPPTNPRDARAWAQRPQPVDLKARARTALVVGAATPLERVGFRPAAQTARAPLDADVVRVVGSFEPALSRLSVLETMVKIARLAVTETSRAEDLAALARAIDGDLEHAPEAALTPLVERLARACDGEDGRPSSSSVRELAEATVLARRGFSRAVLREGVWVRGVLRAGDTSLPLYVPESFERTLPNHARWATVALVRPMVSQDTREVDSTVLAALALGRFVDPRTLRHTPDD